MGLFRRLFRYKDREARKQCEKIGVAVKSIPNYDDAKPRYQAAPEGFIFGISDGISGIGTTPEKACGDYLQKVKEVSWMKGGRGF